MHRKFTYILLYCLVVTRLDKIHCLGLLASSSNHRVIPIIAWAAEHARSF